MKNFISNAQGKKDVLGIFRDIRYCDHSFSEGTGALDSISFTYDNLINNSG